MLWRGPDDFALPAFRSRRLGPLSVPRPGARESGLLLRPRRLGPRGPEPAALRVMRRFVGARTNLRGDVSFDSADRCEAELSTTSLRIWKPPCLPAEAPVAAPDCAPCAPSCTCCPLGNLPPARPNLFGSGFRAPRLKVTCRVFWRAPTFRTASF